MKRMTKARMWNDEKMTKSENARDYEGLFWINSERSAVCEEPDKKRVYDLEERTARFGEMIIDFARTIPQSAVTHRIIGQLVVATTSVGANYVEADDAVSKKEFLKNIGTCSKRSARNQTLPSDGSSRRAGIEATSSKALGGGERIAPHFLENLEEWEMILCIQDSSLLRPSTFSIRHFPYA